MNFNPFQPPYYPFLYLFLSNWNLSSHKSLIYFHVFFLCARHWQSFCLSLSGRLLIKAISPYQWLHHWTKWDPPSLSNDQLPWSLRKGWDLISLSPIQEEMLMGPTYRSLTDNHNCNKFMSEKVLLYPEETFLLFFFFGSSILSTPRFTIFPQPWRAWYKCLTCGQAIHCHLSSAILTVFSVCIDYCLLQ